MNLKSLARRAVSTVLLSMLCVVAFAQTATGVVKDKTGEPMIGVNVLVKGTTNGTITDFDGNFEINDVPSGSTLVVSYIGYLTKEVKAGQNLIIVLEEDTKTLDEVVVIGYGTVKKRDLTGSVASVSADALVANPVSDVSQALQGKLPGVSITTQDGRPGADVAIRVRGGGSISQSNSPLFIVDGFPASSISDIPADQIQSIDVLKDASSTAIYGARGANGVILVTTKGADKDKLSISYSGYFQTKTIAKKLDVLSAQEYLKHTWSYAKSMGMEKSVAEYFGLGSAYGNQWDKYANVEAHDWTEDMLRTANAWNHNVSIAGGSEKTKFTFSVNYNDDEGLKINSGYERFSTNFKLKQNLAKGLDMDLDIRYTETEVTGRESWVNSRGTHMSRAYQYRPIVDPLGTGVDALLGMGTDHVEAGRGPVELTNDVNNINKINNLRGNASLSWEIIKGLTARTEIGLTRRWSESRYYEGGLSSGYKKATLNNSNGQSYRWVNTLNYEVQGLSDDHSLSFLLGHEMSNSESFSSKIEGAGYGSTFDMDRVFGMIHMTDASLNMDKFSTNMGVSENSVSGFARANYSYKGKYLLTATFRADGSSKFAPNNRWGFFPAAAAAWRISDEAFLEDTSDWLSNLKLRLSYGMAGADNISSSLWRETWVSGSTKYNNVLVPTYGPEGLKANPDLKWETTISRNAGLDFGFWNNRLSGTLDFYWNTTKDLLMRQEIDSSTGYSYQYQNVGQTSNKGVEIAVNYDILRGKDYSLTFNATYNYNKNNIDELANGTPIYYGSGWASSATTPGDDYVLREGSPVGVIRGFKSEGYYTLDDFNYVNGVYILKEGIADLSAQVGGSQYRPAHIQVPTDDKGVAIQTAYPGCLKITDMDGNKVIDLDDVVDLGSVVAEHTGGFGLSGTYKGFDASANFTYQIGGNVYNCASLINTFGNKETGLGMNKYAFMKDAFQLYDVQNGELVGISDPAELARLNQNAKYAVPFYENGVTLSTFVEDASYLRLNTLTIGYSLPKNVISKIGMSKARVYATAGNLFCISGYSGRDPEVNADDSKNKNYPTIGGDWGAYPRARTFTFGVNVAF